MLLEFPAPGVTRVPPSSPATTETRSAQQFLDEVANIALGPETHRRKLPLHARTFLTSLHNKMFEASKVIIANLKSLATRLSGVSRRRRLATLTLVPFWIIVCGLVGGAYIHLIGQRFDRKWAMQYPDIRFVRLALQTMDHEWDDEALRAPFKMHIAGHYRHVVTNDNFWNAPETAGLLSRSLRQKALNALEQYPNRRPKSLPRRTRSLSP